MVRIIREKSWTPIAEQQSLTQRNQIAIEMAESPPILECPNVVGVKRARPTDDKTSSSSNSSSSSSSEASWKTMYEDEHTKNTMLNLQLCFVQSECMRLLNLQSDMAGSIATLQVHRELLILKTTISTSFSTHFPNAFSSFTEFISKLDWGCRQRRRRIRFRRRKPTRLKWRFYRRNIRRHEWIWYRWRRSIAIQTKEPNYGSQASENKPLYNNNSIKLTPAVCHAILNKVNR